MLFNSLIFIIFAAVFFVLLRFSRKSSSLNLQWSFLVIASLFFYGWWDWRFIFLILGSGFIDFFAGLLIIKKPGWRKLFLIISVTGNISSLAVFKYSGFIAGNIDYLMNLVGIQSNLAGNIPEFMLILPIGISFYTFQSMSYTIDIYKGLIKPTRNIFHFFAYLSLFPQLVAGPIVRARDLLPQLKHPRHINDLEAWNGFKLIIIGYFKKVVLADNLAPMVNTGFVNIHQTDSPVFWWVMTLGFAFQIYFDFSGYSDIARGLAKWMGFHFKMNFNHPYHSKSLREFWTRWHISLSTWFRDYVYIPLGGSRKGILNSHLFLWITMIVSGLWHGASWTFVIWGGLHAAYISIERITRWPSLLRKFKAGGIISILITNLLVLLGWVFFRAESFSDALMILGNMFAGSKSSEFIMNPDIENGILILFVSVLIEIVTYWKFKPYKYLNQKYQWLAEVVYVMLMILAGIYLRGEGNEFIYFQF